MKYWPSQQWHFPYDRILRQQFTQNGPFQIWELVQIKYSGRWDEIVLTRYIELNKHDKVKTDWFLMKELKACMGDESLKKSWIKQIHTPDISSRKVFQRKCFPGQIALVWLKIYLICRYWILGMQISNFRYANIDFF